MNTFTYDPGIQSSASDRAVSSTSGAAWADMGGVAPVSPATRSSTIVYDPGAPISARVLPSALCVTLVFDPSVGIAQPIGLRTTTIYRSDRPSLRRLFVDLSKRPAGDVPHNLVGAILRHDQLKSILTRACRRVARKDPRYSGLSADVEQQTLLRLEILMLNGKLNYEDLGAKPFHSWLRQVVRRNARKAARQCVPRRAPILLPDLSQIAATAPDSDMGEDLDELRAAIARIPNAAVRQAMEDRSRGWKIAKCVRERGLTRSHIGDIRKRGLEWLRAYLHGD